MITVSWMKVWWIVYNRKLFDNALPEPQFLRKEFGHFGEFSPGVITLRATIDDVATAKATLVHEMMHQWQHQNNIPLDHEEQFQTWAAMILSDLNMEI